MDANRWDYQMTAFLTHGIKLDSESELGESLSRTSILSHAEKNESLRERVGVRVI